MRIRRAVWWTAAAAAALVAAAAAILLSFDLEAYRDEVTAAASRATGRPVAATGELSLTLSLRPKLVAEGVSLGNPPGFSRPETARADRLEAEARLWPLLQGRVEIDRVALIGVDLLLERDVEGRGNWEFAADRGTASQGPPPRIGELQVRDARLAWLADGRTRELRIHHLQAAERDGAIEAELDGEAEGRPLRLKGRFAAAPPRAADAGPVFTARALSLTFGEAEAEGELTLVLAPARPRIDGRVALASLDLDRELGPGAPAQDDRLIPDVALDPAALDALDLALSFEIGRLVTGGLRLEEVKGAAALEAGKLAIPEFAARLAQGRLAASAQAQGRQGRLAAALKLNLARAELAELLPGGGLAGRVDVLADLKGEGADLRALVGTLAGEARLLGREGRIAGRALDLAAADLLRTLAPWTERGADTKVSCMLFASTVRQGRAAVDALVLDADRVLVTGKGNIDLGRERLDLQLTPRPKETSLFSLATPVNVRGPLANPSISPDEAGLARGAAGALLGNLVLPGAGLLLPFLSAGADDHPCSHTLSAAPAASGPAPRREPESGVGGFLRGLGRSIDRTLGTGR